MQEEFTQYFHRPSTLPQGGSEPVSPTSRRVASQTEIDNDSTTEDDGDDDGDDEMLVTADEQDYGRETIDDGAPKTAEEIRAEKRKQKRFRLTHNQTRFLQGEFTRQAHPDAAQRERLSKKIPGLSPRQVQVWFQNRRAKLKRLTTEDRERVLKSRAFPEGFNMTRPQNSNGQQAYPPLPASNLGGCVSFSASPYDGGGFIRPIRHDEFRRQSESETNPSPASTSSVFGGFRTPPGSQSTPENLSPISPHFSLDINLSSQNPFVCSSSYSTVCQSYAHGSWQSLHYPAPRARAESSVSQPRSSIHYAIGTPDHGATSSSQQLSIELARGYLPGESPMGQITALPDAPVRSFLSAMPLQSLSTYTPFPSGMVQGLQNMRTNFPPPLPQAATLSGNSTTQLTISHQSQPQPHGLYGTPEQGNYDLVCGNRGHVHQET